MAFWNREVKTLKARLESRREALDEVLRENAKLTEALNEIIKCETSGANGTVKRMARIAREALRWT